MTTPLVPTAISTRYQLIEKIGAGGMGTVYRAEDRLTGQVVALKQMHALPQKKRNPSTNPETAFLAQEFKFLASLRHPHIISVLDYGFDAASHPYYTMTLLENAQEFADVASQRDLNGKIELIMQVLQALHYLHRRGILHRDLKPANVLIDGQGIVKVVDFGLAVIANEESVPGGTLAYMPPEVLRGDPATIQADLYAVGIMAYELFAGKHPFDISNVIALMYREVETPPDLREIGIAPELAIVVERLLAPDPADRYTSAEDVILALAASTGRSLPETAATRESFLQAAQFVGRDAELNKLLDALRSAVAGQGGIWLVGGESGVGKSRLLEELQTQALLRGALVLRGQAIAEGSTPYQLWRDALRRLSLQTNLTDFDAAVLKPLVTDIERLLGRDIPDLPPIDAQSAQFRQLAVIESIFHQQEQTLVLLLEDLQWADESLILLKRLYDLASQSSLLIVGTYRRDERPNLPQELGIQNHIQLERLSAESIEQLSVSMLGEVGRLQPVIDLLKRETEGNVFFIVEVVRTLAEEAGQLSEIGRKTLPNQVFAGGMQTVIQRRLDRVPASARQLLNIAAVGGREIDLRLLHQLLPSLDLDNWIQQVTTVIEVADDRYRFAHDKLREGILSSLEQDQRRQIHRDLAQAIEAVYPAAPEQYAALAYHWGEAQDAAKTIRFATLAGEQALASGSYRQAIQFFEQALAFNDQAPMGRQQLSQLYYMLGDACWGQTDILKSYDWHVHALNLLGFPVPQKPHQLTLRTLKPALRHMGRWLLGIKSQSGKPEEMLIAARSFDQLTQVGYHSANLPLGLYSVFGGIDATERAGNSLPALRQKARFYSTLGFVMTDIAQHRLARFYFRQAEKCLQGDSDPGTWAWFGFTYSGFLAGNGQWALSNEWMNRSIGYSQQTGNLRMWIQCTEFYMYMLALQSRFAEAIDLIAEPARVAVRDGHVHTIGRFHTAKIRFLFMLGQTTEALAYYRTHEAAIQATLQMGDQTAINIVYYGAMVDCYTRIEDWATALDLAHRLDSEIAKAPTLSFLAGGEVAASIILYLTLWEKQADRSHQGAIEKMFKLYHKKYTNCFAIGNAIEFTCRCWYAWLQGNEKLAREMGARAILAAQTHQLPFYEGLARYHLARFMPADEPERTEHLKKAAHLFEQVGSAYDLARVQALLV